MTEQDSQQTAKQDIQKIGFIGLGNMGLPMAKNLLRSGYTVAGYDVAESALASFAAEGGHRTSSAMETVHGSQVIVTALPTARHVEAVLSGESGALRTARGKTLFIDCSTIDPATARRLATEATVGNMAYVDAPMSGGVGGATAGTLTFMVGGEDEAFARALPVLEAMGKNIFHAGAVGAGSAAKICNNMLLAISMIGTCEAFALAERLGLEAQKLYDISSTATGRCWSLNDYCPAPGPVPTAPSNRSYAPGFSTELMLKDLRLAMEAAQNSGATTPLGAQAAQVYAMLATAGGAELDFSAVLPFLKGELPPQG